MLNQAVGHETMRRNFKTSTSIFAVPTYLIFRATNNKTRPVLTKLAGRFK
jgi:hypothetical protein